MIVDPIESGTGKTLGRGFLALPIVVLLCGHIFFQIVQAGYGRFIGLGDYLWEDYYLLRVDVRLPECNEDAIEDQLEAYMGSQSGEDPFDDLFDEAPNENALRASLEQQQSACLELRRKASANQGKITTGLATFRALDHFLALVADFGRNRQREVFGLLLFLCAAATSLRRAHICLRPCRTVQDYRTASLGELIANMALAYSAYHYLTNAQLSPVAVQYPLVRWLYMGGFSVLTAISLVQFTLLPSHSPRYRSGMKAALCIPIYSYMAIVAALFHLVGQQNPQGIMVYIDKIMDFADIFTNVALYIWVGMLLKQSCIGDMVFSVLRPWRLPPEALAALVIIVMAVPTAYTGASGVLVIAMGGIIYRELRLSGARRQLAAAATAIAGSSGVVLRPCLLVVMIAALNREVTTEKMFEWGGSILLLTAFVFFCIASLGRQRAPRIAPVRFAFKPSSIALLKLLPFIAVFFLVIGFFRLIFDVRMDEFSAPILLPMAALSILFYEKMLASSVPQSTSTAGSADVSDLPYFHMPSELETYTAEQEPRSAATFVQSVMASMTEGSIHAGALLMLMALSLAAGGIIGNAAVLHDIGSWEIDVGIPVAVAALLIMLVLIGMFMDPFGAVMLVSQTLAPVAYQLGMEPLHFWMITLVAFELGYLSPPVAVNHLFTRRIIGEHEFLRAQETVSGRSFWLRHERILLPVLTLAIVLLAVTYVPLLFRL